VPISQALVAELVDALP